MSRELASGWIAIDEETVSLEDISIQLAQIGAMIGQGAVDFRDLLPAKMRGALRGLAAEDDVPDPRAVRAAMRMTLQPRG